jgi:hypothetical protein
LPERRAQANAGTGPHAGTQLLVELGAGQDRFTIGRRGDSDIALDWDGEVSRLHAQPERVGQQGTLVGDGLSRTARSSTGSASGATASHDGDRLCFGATLVPAPEQIAWHLGSPLSSTAPRARVPAALAPPRESDEWSAPVADKLALGKAVGR